MRIYSALLIGVLAVLVFPGDAFCQRGNRGGGGGRGGRGGGGGGFDPGQMFDRVANGKNEIVLAEVSDPRTQGMLKRIVDSLGITDGKITRDQFTQGMQSFQQMRGQRGGAQSGFPSRGGGRNGGQDPSGGPPAGPAQQEASAADVEKWAEAEFKKRDKNGDGVLNEDEMSKQLRAEWQKWDANKDGAIDLKEFKAFYADQLQQRQEQQLEQALILGKPEEDKRPVVFRVGKEPKGLPAWFKQLDTDNDGQIGVYEWRKSGKPLSEFREMDRNGDGFLTMEEVLYYLAKNKGKKTDGPAVASIGGTGGPPSANDGNQGGGRGNKKNRGGGQ